MLCDECTQNINERSNIIFVNWMSKRHIMTYWKCELVSHRIRKEYLFVQHLMDVYRTCSVIVCYSKSDLKSKTMKNKKKHTTTSRIEINQKSSMAITIP